MPGFLAPILGRFGFIGLIGLPVALVGLGGFFAVMNWDTWFGGQTINTIGPNQLNAMLGAVAVAGVGVFLTILGFTRARAPRAAVDLEAAPAAAESVAPPEASRPAPPPVLIEVPEPEAEPAPAAVSIEVEEEEEGEIEIPAAPAPPTPAPVAPAKPLAPPAAPPKPPAPAPAAPPAAAERDELEDLFGELESEVAKAEEEEVHYECPNCHGIVREEDTTCPHCGVVFEG